MKRNSSTRLRTCVQGVVSRRHSLLRRVVPSSGREWTLVRGGSTRWRRNLRIDRSWCTHFVSRNNVGQRSHWDFIFCEQHTPKLISLQSLWVAAYSDCRLLLRVAASSDQSTVTVGCNSQKIKRTLQTRSMTVSRNEGNEPNYIQQNPSFQWRNHITFFSRRIFSFITN
jgi:hypothetical protein